MHQQRKALRALLSALIAERPDAEGLYIPRGEAGMRRMILALLDMRAPEPEGTAMHAMIRAFLEDQAQRDNA